MTYTLYPFNPSVGLVVLVPIGAFSLTVVNINPAYKPFTSHFQPILLILIVFIFGLKGPDPFAWRTGDSAYQMDIMPQPEVVPLSPHL